jgi:hypothetical protein
MALMGKAMNGFCPCEFRKSGSSVVWNTKWFRDKLSWENARNGKWDRQCAGCAGYLTGWH